MHSISRDEFASRLKEQRVKTRLARELRFIPETIVDWDDREMLAVTTRSRGEGLLLVELGEFYLLPYELTANIKDKLTGRSKPVICDLCFTWQQGGKIAQITFRRPSDEHSFTYLCCADLQCSLHVRDMTAAATLSRTQLREDITPERRVFRLQQKLQAIITTLGARPV